MLYPVFTLNPGGWGGITPTPDVIDVALWRENVAGEAEEKEDDGDELLPLVPLDGDEPKFPPLNNAAVA